MSSLPRESNRDSAVDSTDDSIGDVAELVAYDREHLWHPYTSMSDPLPAQLVSGAAGVRLQLADGRSVIDGMSSWWCAIHGYCNPALDVAAVRQLGQMAHVMFGGLTHKPAIELARRLIELSPEPLDRVFFADSGSVSVEVAIKMALQYQRGHARPERTKMLTVLGGYHGDTFGAMGVTDPVGGMHSMFTDVLPSHVFADQPPSDLQGLDEWAAHFTELARTHAAELAGIIVEPVLQGAGGMYIYRPECLQVMRSVADELGLVLIFDEIATGFGRTGTMFAAEHAGVSPDIMTVGKALTGGYLTLAAVLCTAEVGLGLSASESGVLMHGPTFMANPLACSIALANLDLLVSGDWASSVGRISTALAAGLAPGRELSRVKDVRVLGAVGIVQLDAPVNVAAASTIALEHGVWLRPFRDLIYTMPPYICTDDEIAAICTAILEAAA